MVCQYRRKEGKVHSCNRVPKRYILPPKEKGGNEMQNFKWLIMLRRLAFTRGGKVIIGILLFSAATLGAIRFMLWSGTIDQLEGALRVFYNSLSIVLFFTLAAGIFLTLCIKKKVEDARLVATNPNREGNKIIKEKNKLRRWARVILLAWIAILCVVVYAVMGIFMWRESVFPLIQQITSTQYNWLETENLTSLVTSFMLVTLWIIMPVLMYWEITTKPRDRKEDRK